MTTVESQGFRMKWPPNGPVAILDLIAAVWGVVAGILDGGYWPWVFAVVCFVFAIINGFYWDMGRKEEEHG